MARSLLTTGLGVGAGLLLARALGWDPDRWVELAVNLYVVALAAIALVEDLRRAGSRG